MGHKAGLLFASVAGAALAICAYVVRSRRTPGLGAGGAPPGDLAVFFSVSRPFIFSQYQYYLVFNTFGSGITPSTDIIRAKWSGYSYASIALGIAGATYAEPVQFRFSTINPHIPPAWLVGA
ncbi:MAG: hypothetical protein WA431_08860 [Candidatus Cybelea sp.]